jgi:hypothetical protein
MRALRGEKLGYRAITCDFEEVTLSFGYTGRVQRRIIRPPLPALHAARDCARCVGSFVGGNSAQVKIILHPNHFGATRG